jgi:hypothetical protein
MHACSSTSAGLIHSLQRMCCNVQGPSQVMCTKSHNPSNTVMSSVLDVYGRALRRLSDIHTYKTSYQPCTPSCKQPVPSCFFRVLRLQLTLPVNLFKIKASFLFDRIFGSCGSISVGVGLVLCPWSGLESWLGLGVAGLDRSRLGWLFAWAFRS